MSVRGRIKVNIEIFIKSIKFNAFLIAWIKLVKNKKKVQFIGNNKNLGA